MDMHKLLLALRAGPSEIRDFRVVVGNLSDSSVALAAPLVDADSQYPEAALATMAQGGLLARGAFTEGDRASALAGLVAVEEIARNCPSSAYTLACHVAGDLLTQGWADRTPSDATIDARLALSRRTRATATGDREGDGSGSRRECLPAGPSGSVAVWADGWDIGARGGSADVASGPDVVHMARVGGAADGERVPLSHLGLRGVATQTFDATVAESVVSAPVDAAAVARAASRYHLGATAVCLGAARGSLEQAFEYVQSREQFRRPLVDFGGVQLGLIEAIDLWDLHALRLYETVLSLDNDPAMPAHARRVRLSGQHAAERVCDVSLQFLGGYGYVHEYGQERRLRDVKTIAHIDGPQLPFVLASAFGATAPS